MLRLYWCGLTNQKLVSPVYKTYNNVVYVVQIFHETNGTAMLRQSRMRLSSITSTLGRCHYKQYKHQQTNERTNEQNIKQ